MNKVPTLFVRDPKNMSRVLPEINPEAAWVLDGHDAVATVKKDGTNVAVLVWDGPYEVVLKRRNPSREEKDAAEREGRPKPEPIYVVAKRDDPADKHIFAAVDATDFSGWPEGYHSCEALGPKIQGGVESDVPVLYPFLLRPELIESPRLVPDFWSVNDLYVLVEDFLRDTPIEGIVWHGKDGKMAKIKRRDFGLPWPPKERG
jgi:hypothetical protein